MFLPDDIGFRLQIQHGRLFFLFWNISQGYKRLFWLRGKLTQQMNCEECNQAGAAGRLQKHMRAIAILLLTVDTLRHDNPESVQWSCQLSDSPQDPRPAAL